MYSRMGINYDIFILNFTSFVRHEFFDDCISAHEHTGLGEKSLPPDFDLAFSFHSYTEV